MHTSEVEIFGISAMEKTFSPLTCLHEYKSELVRFLLFNKSQFCCIIRGERQQEGLNVNNAIFIVLLPQNYYVQYILINITRKL